MAEPIKDVTNRYLKWLRWVNPGMLHPGNLYCFQYATENLPSDNPILEIGSFCGLSINAISYYMTRAKRTNKIFTSDKWRFEGVGDDQGQISDSGISWPEFSQFVKGTYMRNVQFFSSKNVPHTIESLSDDFFKMWDANLDATDVFGRSVHLGGPLSFVFIDGDHTYEYASRDFHNTDKYLEKGGFVLFDDSFDGNTFGTPQLMREILENPNYELVLKNPNYLFRKIS